MNRNNRDEWSVLEDLVDRHYTPFRFAVFAVVLFVVMVIAMYLILNALVP